MVIRINQNIRLTRTLCSLPGLYNGKFAGRLLSLSGLTEGLEALVQWHSVCHEPFLLSLFFFFGCSMWFPNLGLNQGPQQ